MKILLTIVYDNYIMDRNLKSGHGFSCMIEEGESKILFDTGNSPDDISFNLKMLGIEPQQIDTIVLSHNHWDHCGGLDAVIDRNKKLQLYYPESFPESFKQNLTQKGIKNFGVYKMTKIEERILVGPQMGRFGPKEIPLTIETERGLVIITGCAHPGIVKMVRTLSESLGERVYLVLGGFHLEFSLRSDKVVSGLKNLGVERIAPCHCTGKRAIGLFATEFKENFIKVGTGTKVPVY